MPNFDLNRFLTAQSAVYNDVLAELTAGRKRTHWMWFIFPQVTGLGSSSMAQRYAISGLPEAVAYLTHPTLGDRLRECTALVSAVANRTLDQILGYPDDLKFHSSVTLFHQAAQVVPDESSTNLFHAALTRFFDGSPDQATLSILHPTR